MAVTQEQATQVSNPVAVPPTLNDANEVHGKLRIFHFSFTQGSAAGDAGSLAEIAKLPGGSTRVFLPLSRIAFSAMGASRTMDLGWLAYTDQAGDAVTADPNGLDDGVDVSSAGSVNPAGTVGGSETYLFESNGGVTITAQINDGTIPAAATLKGYIVYTTD